MLHWSYWPAKLLWLRQTQPELFKRVRRWISFGEFLVEQLTGQRAASVSMASGTGLLDQHRVDWDAELLEVLGIQPDHLNTLAKLTTTAQRSKWPQLRDVPWIPAVGDGACSNVGAGCTTPDLLDPRDVSELWPFAPLCG